MNLDAMSENKSLFIRETTESDFTKFIGEMGFRLTLVGAKYLTHARKTHLGYTSTYTFKVVPFTQMWVNRNEVVYLTVEVSSAKAAFYFRRIENGNVLLAQYRNEITTDVLFGLDENYLPSVNSWMGEVAELTRSFVFRETGKVLRMKSTGPSLNFRYM